MNTKKFLPSRVSTQGLVLMQDTAVWNAHQSNIGKFLLVWPAVSCLASRPGVETRPGRYPYCFTAVCKNY